MRVPVDTGEYYTSIMLRVDEILAQYMVKNEDVAQHDKLDAGETAVVYSCTFRGHPAAVKVMKGTDALAQDRVKEEAALQASMTHPNVVKLFGICLEPPMVVMELCSRGSLEHHLTKLKEQGYDIEAAGHARLARYGPIYVARTYRCALFSFTFYAIAVVCLQLALVLMLMRKLYTLSYGLHIATGLEYLESILLIHRDLATRNVIMNDVGVCKIADFGLSKRILSTSEYYRVTRRGRLPLRWMAPEAIKRGMFTAKSDVWSFGVVLWEVYTLASMPYFSDVIKFYDSSEVIEHVLGKQTLECPDGCPDKAYAAMKLCWMFDPEARPAFTELRSLMKGIRTDAGPQDPFEP